MNLYKQVYNIVLGYKKYKSIFDQTNYNKNYIPPVKFHKSRKPKLQQWNDDKIYPNLYPPIMKQTPKQLISLLRNEQYQQIILKKDFFIPEMRSGDVIEFEYLHSISSQSSNVYQGLLVDVYKKNNLNHSFSVIFRHCGVEAFMKIKICSPLLKNLKVIAKSTGRQNRVLRRYWKWRTFQKIDTLKPVTRGNQQRQKNQQIKRLLQS